MITPTYNLKSSNSGRLISNIRSVARRCWIGIRHSLAVAQGHKRAIRTKDKRSDTISGQIRESFNRSTGEAGSDDQSNGGDEQRIREFEKRFLENKRKIFTLQSSIVSHIVRQLKAGELNEIPAVTGISQLFPGGITLKLMHVTPGFDIFLCSANKGATIEAHTHIQEQTIYVIKGCVEYAQEGAQDTKTLVPGDRLIIPAHEQHTVELKKDSKYIVIFRPPISFNPLTSSEWMKTDV